MPNLCVYDSRSLQCKSPFGALATGEEAVFRIYLPILRQLHSPSLLLYRADEWENPQAIPMELEGSDGVSDIFRCAFRADAPQLYFYRFRVLGAQKELYVSRDQDGFGRLTLEAGEMWQLTVYDHGLHTPDFLKTGVMYQIFPDRFFASGKPKQGVPSDRWIHPDWNGMPAYLPNEKGEVTNSDYFGGDLAGITEKLPYLHALGVTVLYLNPIFEAHSNHRYNTADYQKIDPLLGSEEDFRELCAKGREWGIRIIIDGVFNHTGSDSVYFNKNKRYGEGGAYNDPNSPYRSWYEFTDYPNYRSWWGFETLPNLNESDPGYSDFICGEDGVLQKWLKAGLSGWRLDVADELPDAFLDRIRQSVKAADPQAAIIGEVWEDASTKVSYGVRRRYLLGSQLDSVMNYPFKDAILNYIRYGDSNRLYTTVMDILEHYPKPVLDVLMNSLSTHDVERALTALAGEPVGQNGREWQAAHHHLTPEQYAKGKKLLKLASLIQYTLPGIPCLYYGDEAGLYGYKDPFNRTCYPWGREDRELLDWFTRLGQLRARYPQLSSGGFRAVLFGLETVAFERDCGEWRMYIAVNRTEQPVRLMLPAAFARGADYLLGGLQEDGCLPAYGYAVVLQAAK